MDNKQTRRWRLILGQEAEKLLGSPRLENEEFIMDAALAAIYDAADTDSVARGGRSAGLKRGVPNLAKWLGDVRSFFPPDIVSVIQSDAIERRGLTQLLFEPETLSAVKPDISMVRANASNLVKRCYDLIDEFYARNSQFSICNGLFLLVRLPCIHGWGADVLEGANP